MCNCIINCYVRLNTCEIAKQTGLTRQIGQAIRIHVLLFVSTVSIMFHDLRMRSRNYELAYFVFLDRFLFELSCKNTHKHRDSNEYPIVAFSKNATITNLCQMAICNYILC